MQTISANLTAGVRAEFSLPGALFFMLLETVGPVDIELQTVNGGHSEIAEGVESGFREKAQSNTDRIGKVILTSATTQAVKFGHSVRDADNRKVTSTVAVVDGSVERTIAGEAFVLYGGSVAVAVAGEYGLFELSNVSANKNIILDQITLFHQDAADTFLSVVYFDAAITHTTQYADVNKKSGNAEIGAVDSWSTSEATIPGNDELMSRAMAQYEGWEVPIEGPFVIPAGKGIGFLCSRVNTTLTINLSGHIEVAA
ncbi:MAG: hypothetical protein AB9Q19_00480 [Candidatus Reddybacter sp.]